jgi:hypothetical protein
MLIGFPSFDGPPALVCMFSLFEFGVRQQLRWYYENYAARLTTKHWRSN